MSQSIVCVYCAKPMLDVEHAKAHVKEKCEASPYAELRSERDAARKEAERLRADLEERTARQNELWQQARAAAELASKPGTPEEIVGLRRLAQIARDASTQFQDWIGHASTRNAAMDCMFRLERALAAGGYPYNGNAALGWRGSVLKELNDAGFFFSEAKDAFVYDPEAEKAPPFRNHGNAVGPTLKEVVRIQESNTGLRWKADSWDRAGRELVTTLAPEDNWPSAAAREGAALGRMRKMLAENTSLQRGLSEALGRLDATRAMLQGAVGQRNDSDRAHTRLVAAMRAFVDMDDSPVWTISGGGEVSYYCVACNRDERTGAHEAVCEVGVLWALLYPATSDNPSLRQPHPDECPACGHRGLSLDKLNGACPLVSGGDGTGGCPDPMAWLRLHHQDRAPGIPA